MASIWNEGLMSLEPLRVVAARERPKIRDLIEFVDERIELISTYH